MLSFALIVFMSVVAAYILVPAAILVLYSLYYKPGLDQFAVYLIILMTVLILIVPVIIFSVIRIVIKRMFGVEDLNPSVSYQT